MRLIDADALYEKACNLEAQALDYAVKISHDEEKVEEWRRWSAILAERTAFKNDVYDAPTIEPEPRWIPCSERLPEDDTLMLVNYIDNRPEAMDIWIGWHEMENVWYIDGKAHSKEYGNEVIAWMPLPETYKEKHT